ncbi:hypothetical protein [Paenibacillus sp. R14(2021)]|uniref:hypothetical protein n=1 Tax=Paenibacillus sp. R14(2021) TaxID=2859228 RepID=UPI001C612144|nr:hypothetical protein [Paenibacillus sp. R14(2021)]
MMKKILVVLGTLILLLVAAGAGIAWYVKPAEKLDLSYNSVQLIDRAITMLKQLNTQFELSEQDVNNIGKAYIAAQPEYAAGVTVTGARFQFEGDRLAGHYNLRIGKRIPAGIVVYYRVQWREPNLVAAVDEVKLKGISLPAGSFDDIVIPLGRQLPALIHIQSASIVGDKLVIAIRKPTLRELRDLLRRELGLQAG